MLSRTLLFACLAAVAVFASAENVSEKSEPKSGYFQLGTDFNIGFNGGPTDPMFAVDTVDKYGKNWRGLRIPLETARSYEERVEPFFMLSFRAGYKNFHFLLEAPLRKDLEAWYNSELKTNFTYKPSELDINVPINAYAKWDNSVGFVQFGRFDPEDLKISKNDVFLGGLPYHDGIHWNLKIGIFRYDFLLSSLNAWLFYDVINHETGCPPEGSEAYAQKCTQPGHQVSNQRNRTYTENVKNLVFHRLGVDTRKFWLYLVEQSMIGGKSLEFRSFNPFMYWHDNYATGYTSAATSVELGYKTSNGAKFYTQINMEDIASPVGEDKKMGTNRSIINYMVGYYHELETRNYGKFSWRLDVVKTDPAAGNSRLPLLKYTGRRNYRSNYREQGDSDYADAYFVDYPVGYRRGGDALDLWFDMNWKWSVHSASLTLAWLRQGDKEIYTDYDKALKSENSLSGIVEKQFLVDVLYERKVSDWFKFYAGGGFRVFRNLAHDKNEDGSDAWIRSGVKFNFNPVDMKF
ncbi:hypothetical protein [Fibrobacter sp. UWB12]|uniref:hypothetical protein n=1 Tax=Fibrobacter sp. UWB12 TaxID=1896203 RepID=UPI00091E893D|nr:hypothetical protein [Fibrobacter sp. UWB12]SHK19046.1 hypothetical protein SAMN05720759_10122 [Fibrobacter sp. UWB12]